MLLRERPNRRRLVVNITLHLVQWVDAFCCWEAFIGTNRWSRNFAKAKRPITENMQIHEGMSNVVRKNSFSPERCVFATWNVTRIPSNTNGGRTSTRNSRYAEENQPPIPISHVHFGSSLTLPLSEQLPIMSINRLKLVPCPSTYGMTEEHSQSRRACNSSKYFLIIPLIPFFAHKRESQEMSEENEYGKLGGCSFYSHFCVLLDPGKQLVVRESHSIEASFLTERFWYGTRLGKTERDAILQGLRREVR